MNKFFRKRVLLLLMGLLSLFSFCNAQQHKYKKTTSGIIVYPDERYANRVKSVQLQVVNEKIIRVIASPENTMQPFNSFSVLPFSDFTSWSLTENETELHLSTSFITAKVDKISAAVSFINITTGETILAEKKSGGRLLEPVMHEGNSMWRVGQHFQTDEEDAYYGLGQHQDDVMNYKGKQVQFFQNNTVVAVPYLVSAKNYGLLWDNYSYSLAGETRPFQPISGLRLFDKNGNEGWLTASYANDRTRADDIAFELAESEMDYAWLNDTKLKLPKDFNIEKGSITWKGSISANYSGVYQFRFTYGGYLRLHLGGKEIFNKWRRAWNPAAALAEYNIQAGEKVDFELEWIPDGGESYLSAGFLPPALEKNIFGFDSEAGRQIDYYFVYGDNMDDVIKGYRQLTGKSPIVPRWAMGFWQSRERYKSQKELMDVVANFRRKKIPLDNIVQDWFYWKENDWGSQEFDLERFPDVGKMINDLHKQYNVKLMISVWPKFYEGIAAYKDFDKKGWLYKRNIANQQKDWVGPGYVSTFYDVFNENARKGFWDLLNKNLFSKGVDAWWMDASEPDILSNSSPIKRKQQMLPNAMGSAAEWMNAYPLLNAKGIYEGQRSTAPNKRVFLLTRSAYAGSQRYAASVWSGDVASRWEDMKAQISAGINYSLSGLPWWTMDIGGFVVEPRFENPNETDLEEWREMQTRWFQWGAFLPLFRSHGQYPFRESFNIAPDSHPAFQSMLYYNKLRYRLLPYTYSLAGKTWHQDYTIMRGLVMDFGHDKNVINIGDQFMFGQSLLVSPVYAYKATTRKVYLPKGQGWYDLYTGKYVEGGKEVVAEAPYEKMPVFVKEGSIIPTGPELQYTSEKPQDAIVIHVYTGKDAAFTLYEDEGSTYDYEKGEFSTIGFNYNEATKKLIIEDRNGSFPGMLKERTFYIKQISPDKPEVLSFDYKKSKKVKYSGKRITVKL